MRAGIYGRQSTDKKCSIDQQIGEGQADCAELGWTVARVYRDGSSASRFRSKERLEWPQVLDDVAGDELDVVWLWESSRGDRELESWAGFLSACRRHGKLIRIGTHERTYDMEIPRDWRTLADDGVASAYEVELTSKRVRRGMGGAALAGRPHGKPLWGYDRVYEVVDGKPTLVEVRVDEQVAPIIRDMVTKRLAGESEYLIAKWLNEKSVPTPRGEVWTASKVSMQARRPRSGDGSVLDVALADAAARIRGGESPSAIAREFRARPDLVPPSSVWTAGQVKRLLLNPSYNGKRAMNGQIMADAMWPAIIDDRDHLVLTAMMTGRPGQRPAAVKHLLSGLGRCGRCGGRLRVLNNRGCQSYSCIDCWKVSRVQHRVDDVVLQTLIRFLERRDAREILARAAPGGDEIAAALAELETLQARLDGFYADAAVGRLSRAGLAKMEPQMLADIDAARRRSRRVALAPVVEQVLGPDAAERLDALEMSQLREVLAALLVVRIMPAGAGARTWNPRLIEIEWVFGELPAEPEPEG